MASPDRSLYTQLPGGSFFRTADFAGPFSWDGTSMQLQGGSKAAAVARLLSAAASVNATVVKATPGAISSIFGYNAAAAVRYLKLYNKVAAPTVGTDVPVLTLHLPATAPFSFNFGDGLSFSLGIGYGFTVAAADADVAALTAADIICLNVVYQ